MLQAVDVAFDQSFFRVVALDLVKTRVLSAVAAEASYAHDSATHPE